VVVGAPPFAVFLRELGDGWLALGAGRAGGAAAAAADGAATGGDADAARIAERLTTHGASFAHDLAAACQMDEARVHAALRTLAAAGVVSSDSFAGLRAIAGTGGPGRAAGLERAGRWFLLPGDTPTDAQRAAAVDALARALLARYGVMFRRLLVREAQSVPWRDLVRVYRRLEARGEIRGGRFVAGPSGEQFALPDAVERLREVRRTTPDDRLTVVSGADPLNLTGILTDGERVRTSTSSRIVYRNGVPLAALEGDMLRMLAVVEPAIAPEVAAAAAGRRVPVLSGFVGRVSGG
jgi:ATP-dependent Lhr-like helicase